MGPIWGINIFGVKIVIVLLTCYLLFTFSGHGEGLARDERASARPQAPDQGKNSSACSHLRVEGVPPVAHRVGTEAPRRAPLTLSYASDVRTWPILVVLHMLPVAQGPGNFVSSVPECQARDVCRRLAGRSVAVYNATRTLGQWSLVRAEPGKRPQNRSVDPFPRSHLKDSQGPKSEKTSQLRKLLRIRVRPLQ